MELADTLDGSYWRTKWRSAPPTLIVPPDPEEATLDPPVPSSVPERQQRAAPACAGSAGRESARNTPAQAEIDPVLEEPWLDGRYWQETNNSRRALRRLALEKKRARSPERHRRASEETAPNLDGDSDEEEEEEEEMVWLDKDQGDLDASSSSISPKRRRHESEFVLSQFVEAREDEELPSHLVNAEGELDLVAVDDPETALLEFCAGRITQVSNKLLESYLSAPSEFWPPIIENQNIPTERCWHLFLALHRKLDQASQYDWVSLGALLEREQFCEPGELLSRVVYLANLWRHVPLGILKSLRPMDFGRKFDLPKPYYACTNFDDPPSLRDSKDAREVWIELVHCHLRYSKSPEIDSYFLRDNVECPALNVALSILLAKYYRDNPAFLKSDVLKRNNLMGFCIIIVCFKTLAIDVNLMYPPLLDLINIIPVVPWPVLHWLQGTFARLYRMGEDLSPLYQRICIILFEKKQLCVLEFLRNLFLHGGFHWNKEVLGRLKLLAASYPDAMEQFSLCTSAMIGSVILTEDDLTRAFEGGYAKPYVLQLIARYLGRVSASSPMLAFHLIGRALASREVLVAEICHFDVQRFKTEMKAEQLNALLVSFEKHCASGSDLTNMVSLYVACAPILFSWVKADVAGRFAGSGLVIMARRFRDQFKLEYSPVARFFFGQAMLMGSGPGDDSWIVEQCVEFSLKILALCGLRELTRDPLYGLLHQPKCPITVLRGIFAPLLCSPPPKSDSTKFAFGLMVMLRALNVRLSCVADLQFLDFDYWRHAIWNTFQMDKKLGEKLRVEFRKLLPHFSEAQQAVLTRELRVQATQFSHDQCCQVGSTWNAFPSLEKR
jgi:hypothetical protein